MRWAADLGTGLLLDVVDDGGPVVHLYDRSGWRLVGYRDADWLTPTGDRPRLRVYAAPD